MIQDPIYFKIMYFYILILDTYLFIKSFYNNLSKNLFFFFYLKLHLFYVTKDLLFIFC